MARKGKPPIRQVDLGEMYCWCSTSGCRCKVVRGEKMSPESETRMHVQYESLRRVRAES